MCSSHSLAVHKPEKMWKTTLILPSWYQHQKVSCHLVAPLSLVANIATGYELQLQNIIYVLEQVCRSRCFSCAAPMSLRFFVLIVIYHLLFHFQGGPVDPVSLPWAEDHQHPRQRSPHPRLDHHQPLCYKATAWKPAAGAFSQGSGVLYCSKNISKKKQGLNCISCNTQSHNPSKLF